MSLAQQKNGTWTSSAKKYLKVCIECGKCTAFVFDPRQHHVAYLDRSKRRVGNAAGS